MRSLVHLFQVAAARLPQKGQAADYLKKLAADLAQGRADGMGWTEADDKRIDAHRTLFNLVPNGGAKDVLKRAILQRAYDLMWDGDCGACDALLEFVPGADADAMMDDWCADMEAKPDTKLSKWHGGGG